VLPISVNKACDIIRPIIIKMKIGCITFLAS